MIATFARGTCLPNFGWTAFRFTQGAWQLVPNGSIPRSCLRGRRWVGHPGDCAHLRHGDGHCFPWRWDEVARLALERTRFTASPWEQKTSEAPVKGAAFYSPSGGIQKRAWERRQEHQRPESQRVECWTLRPPRKATLYPGGRLIICSGSEARCKLANIGEAPTPGYGKQTTVGRFRCLSLPTGMRCTLIQSGTGFLINRDGVTRVG